ncbi:hypothetical protein FQN50_005589 [Emmonsiellopsis sp. PD_5]|nr:hypothetical protein FQN50_005589 [Emmonsiellopsis sp. PD_5]
MKLLLPLLLLGSPTAHAWVFRWHDPSNEAHIELGTRSQACKKIDLIKGKQYKWDPEGSKYCVHLFSDEKCEDRNGWSCLIWGPRTLGQPVVKAFRVDKEDGKGDDETTSKTATATATDTKTATTTAATTTGTGAGTATTLSTQTTPASPSQTGPTQSLSPAPAQTAPPSDTSSSPSGGSIAGIVIGVLVGAGLLAALGLILYRRRRRQAKQASQPNVYPLPPQPEDGLPPAPKPEHPTELESSLKQPTELESPVKEPPPPFSPGAGSDEKEAVVAGYYGGKARGPVELPDNSVMAEMQGSPVSPVK